MKLIIKKMLNYKQKYGIKATLKRVIFGRVVVQNGIDPQLIVNLNKQNNFITRIYDDRFQGLSALNVYTIPNVQIKRINLVTDSVNEDSLFGGVITAILFAVQLANAKDTEIRIITRVKRAEEFRVRGILQTFNLKFANKISFVFAHFLDNKAIEISDNDYFITTSWWTTYSTLRSISPAKIIYILQEDERMFYPLGDEHLLSSEILSNSEINYVINTKLLYDHLISTGLDNIKSNGQYFEPAFDENNLFWKPDIDKAKKKLFFYARPNNVRNLFYRGILVLEQAISLGIIDTNIWDVYFVGKDLPKNMKFANGYSPKIVTGLNYLEYGEFVRSVDLGLCLMYTPHPSYPPLDLAAAGAAVVTNKCGNKVDLSNYSQNILCVDSSLDGLLAGLKDGVKLAMDVEKRKNNYDNDNIVRDWTMSFNAIIQNINLG